MDNYDPRVPQGQTIPTGPVTQGPNNIAPTGGYFNPGQRIAPTGATAWAPGRAPQTTGQPTFDMSQRLPGQQPFYGDYSTRLPGQQTAGDVFAARRYAPAGSTVYNPTTGNISNSTQPMADMSKRIPGVQPFYGDYSKLPGQQTAGDVARFRNRPRPAWGTGLNKPTYR